MWIFFGWDKDKIPLGYAGLGYCFDCRREVDWIVVNDAEWVVLYELRAIKFNSRYELHCDSCTFYTALSKRDFRRIKRGVKRHGSVCEKRFYKKIMNRIETEQMAEKSDLQKRFIYESIKGKEDFDKMMKLRNRGDEK